jgi:protein-L-isoaspartate(D-aspartate) O-methyltransferase
MRRSRCRCPGWAASISCPHSYPLFYEALGLGEGHRFLEVGTGSGYGAALAREVTGRDGLVVSVEIDPVTLAFAAASLNRAGYCDAVRMLGDARSVTCRRRPGPPSS